MSRFTSRPLPTKDDALAFAREMVQREKWTSIKISEGTTKDGGEGLVLRACADCWIIAYDPSPTEAPGDERIWVEKSTGVVVKMILDD